jgi:RNA-splicing ligase RtcB
MAVEAATVIETVLGARLCWETVISTDHNHVSLERHGNRDLWVHRKGAMRASLGEGGVLPGSMGVVSASTWKGVVTSRHSAQVPTALDGHSVEGWLARK